MPTQKGNNLIMVEYYTFVEKKLGIDCFKPEHPEFAPVDSTWLNYIQSAYVATGKVVENSVTTASNNSARAIYVKFASANAREEYLADPVIRAGYNALMTFDNQNRIGTIHMDDDFSFPRKIDSANGLVIPKNVPDYATA
jgi:hypothetical protein